MTENPEKRLPVICVANQKGGVGKTTTAIQLADGLTHHGRRVLLIDLDAQGNAGSIFLEDDEIKPERSTYAVFKDRKPVRELAMRTRNERLDVLPSVFQLAEVETLLAGAVDGFFRISEALNRPGDYDYVIMDCPPNLGMLTVNAFVSATHLIVPLQTSKFSLDGIQGILDTCQTIRKRFNPRIEILGALLTMFNPRTAISQAILGSIEEFIPIFNTRVSRAVAVEEAHLLRRTIFEYESNSKVAQEYKEFTAEVLHGIEKG